MTTCNRGHEQHSWNLYSSGQCRSCSRARSWAERTGYTSELDIQQESDEIFNELKEHEDE